MIPKIIHYCWLSNDPLPSDLLTYIEGWKKKLDGYQVICWDLKRFDINSSIWVKQAFECQKYAFAADYIRLYALYNYGGIYLDSDVEVIKPFDSLLNLSTIIGFENAMDKRLEMAIVGAEKGSSWVKCCLEYYENRPFILEGGSFDMKVLPLVVRDCLRDHEFKLHNVLNEKEAKNCENGIIPVFPYWYFSPKVFGQNSYQKFDETYTVHHFAGSWLPWYVLLEKRIASLVGFNFKNYISRIINKIFNS